MVRSASRTSRLYPQECSWYLFSLGACSTPGKSEDICHWKIQSHHHESIPGPSDYATPGLLVDIVNKLWHTSCDVQNFEIKVNKHKLVRCTCAPCLKRGSRCVPGHSHRQVKVVADICWGSTIERCLKALKQFFAAYSDSYRWGERSRRSVNSSFCQVNERLLIVCHLFDTWKFKNFTYLEHWVAVTVFSPSHVFLLLPMYSYCSSMYS